MTSAWNTDALPPSALIASTYYGGSTVDMIRGIAVGANDELYGLNKRLVTLEGRLLRLALKCRVTREDFEEIEVLGKGSFARVVLDLV